MAVVVVAAGMCLPVASAQSSSSAVTDETDAARADRLNDEAVKAIRSDLMQAESLSQQALRAAQAAGAGEAEALANINLGRIARSRGNFAGAVERFTEARRISEALNDRRGLARLAADFAILYSVAGLLDEALAEADKARELFAEIGDRGAESSVLITLGNINSSRGDRDLARRNYQEALKIKEAEGIEKGVGIAINNLADLELESGNIELSLARIDQAMALHEKAGDDVSLALAESNRAIGLARLGRFEQAREAASRGATISEHVGDVRLQAGAERSMAQVLRIQAADLPPASSRELLDRAAQRLTTAMQLLADTDDSDRKEQVRREASEIDELRGEYKKALAHLRAAEVEADQRKERIEKARSDVLAARYQSERQIAEIAALTQQAELREAEFDSQVLYRRLLLVALLATALLLTLVALGLMQHRRHARQLTRSNAALSAALAEAGSQRSTAEALARTNAEVLRIAAEDLQEPLLEIRMQSERIMAAADLDPKLRNQIASISARSATAEQTVRNLIETDELDRHDAIENPVEFDLVELSRVVAESLNSRAAAKRQQIDIALPEKQQLTCRGDRQRLAEALDHLLDNAIKFGPFGQRIRFSVALDRSVVGEERALVRIVDQGPGLQSQDQQRVFGRFQRLTARPTGGESSVGLGLALVQRIVDLHGGLIDARNPPEGGAEFRLWLPVTAVGTVV